MLNKTGLFFCFCILVACGGGEQGNTSASSDFSNSPSPTSQVKTHSVMGSAVKGPLSNAEVNIYRFDSSKVDFLGDKISSGFTDSKANISEILVTEPLNDAYILEVVSTEATTDISTGKAPYFSRMLSIVSAQDLREGHQVSVTPMTTLATQASLSLSPESSLELVELAYSKALIVSEKLGFGLSKDIDIFHTPAVFHDESTAEISDTLAYRNAIEGIAAVVEYGRQNSNVSSDDLLQALGLDLSDGKLDSLYGERQTMMLDGNDYPTLTTRVKLAPVSHLPVPNLVDSESGELVKVSEIERALAEEVRVTAPNMDPQVLLLPENQINPTPLSGDLDLDGWPDGVDEDDDNDGVSDEDDAFPQDRSETLDTDGDGVGNNSDTDDDNDNVTDEEDAFPLDASESLDTDKDGIGNNSDADDDNDGVSDAEDAFPLDAGESLDTDKDGIGNNTDTDDDNDGVSDAEDAFPLDAGESLDTDKDGIGNNTDTDDDNDGVVDGSDAFPLDAGESLDTDKDGIGNNVDTDDDNDGVTDEEDAFPLDVSESLDTDKDGIGNNTDDDDDNDGVVDGNDAFPLDANESLDTDKDGIGDNADTDDDNDGVSDVEDALPLDNSESLDTDGDGIGNNADTDDDNDSYLDSLDAFPLERACWLESHAINTKCDYTATMPVYTPNMIISDENDTVYLISATHKRVDRWSFSNNAYMAPIFLGDFYDNELKSSLKATYSEDVGRLYLGYPDGVVTYLDENAVVERIFMSHQSRLDALHAIEDKLLVYSDNSSRTYTFYDASGEYVSSGSGINLESVAWSGTTNTLYVTGGSIHVYSLGTGTTLNRQLRHYDRWGRGKLYVSPFGVELVDSRGSNFDAASLRVNHFEQFAELTGVVWLDSEKYLSTRYVSNTYSRLQVWKQGGKLLGEYTLNGRSLALVKSKDKLYWVKAVDSGVEFMSIELEADRDSDGVIDYLDAFIDDASASVDEDEDGYPDEWNQGKSEIDSTAGLILDASPGDFRCKLASQINNEGQCSYDSYYAAAKAQYPDQRHHQPLFVDKDGIAFYHAFSTVIFDRYSVAEQTHLKPIKLSYSDLYTHYTYDNSHHMLFLGLESGRIAKIDLNQSQPQAEILPLQVSDLRGLHIVGDVLVLEDLKFAAKGGLESYRYVSDLEGNILSKELLDYLVLDSIQSGNRVVYNQRYHVPFAIEKAWGYVDYSDSGAVLDSDSKKMRSSLFSMSRPQLVNRGKHLYIDTSVLDLDSMSYLRELPLGYNEFIDFKGKIVGHRGGRTLSIFSPSSLSLIREVSFEHEISAIRSNGENLILIQESPLSNEGYFQFSIVDL